MTADAIPRARQFVASLELPAPPAGERSLPRPAAPAAPFDSAREQATVVGSDVISFVKGITPEQRQDIVNASLLAQLVAKRKVAAPATLQDVKAWYDAYFDVLSNIGFLIQDKGFATYAEKSSDFEAHEAILDVAGGFLAGAPGALALVKTTLTALRKVSDGAWITLFNRASQSANTARFQVSLVDSDESAPLLLRLMAFGLEARTHLTQVLFFKFRSNEVKIEHHSGKVTIATDVLGGVRTEIAAKLLPFAKDFVANLPPLGDEP